VIGIAARTKVVEEIYIMSESMKKLDFKAQALPQIDNLYRTALYVSDDESKAYDLVQESFVKAYHSWPEGQISPNPRVWLFRIMTNVLINKYRKWRRRI
jgi:RNA polymerase sigma-70 factor (ECF subfamily)